jgi:CsoR family transcriptional regulator, copper-sensing transcriptional repressor
METHYGYYKSKDALLKRLNRVEGQIRGISKMVSDDRYCIDILTQISAVEAAMDKVALELVREHARHCLTNDHTGPTSRDEKVDELVGAVGRLLSK